MRTSEVAVENKTATTVVFLVENLGFGKLRAKQEKNGSGGHSGYINMLIEHEMPKHPHIAEAARTIAVIQNK